MIRGENLKFNSKEWISETQEYAFPITINGHKFLFFNGNGYGKTGLGYSILKNKMSQSLSNLDIEKTILRYNKRLKEYGYDQKSVGWGIKGRQKERFKILLIS